jgi:hypothetical protein
MFFYLFSGLAAVGIIVHLMLDKSPHTHGRVAEVALLYILSINVGLGGLMAFMGHAFRADQIAAGIGWPAGSPFQSEVAAANLAFGVLGLACLRWRGGFWLATGLGYSVFLLGDAYTHIRDILLRHNTAVYNAGPVLYIADIAMPLLLLTLLALYRNCYNPE